MSNHHTRRPTGIRSPLVISAVIVVVFVVVATAILLMAMAAGYGSSLVGHALGGRVVLIGVAGALIMPVPLVLFWALPATLRPVGEAAGSSRGSWSSDRGAIASRH